MTPLEAGKRDLVKCEDMRLHAERARQFVGSHTLEEFFSDQLVQDAVIRCVEVIGEAARQVSPASCAIAPAIPWARIVGMRNLLAHDYGGVDLEQVYGAVTESVPPLIENLTELIAKLEREVGWSGEE